MSAGLHVEKAGTLLIMLAAIEKIKMYSVFVNESYLQSTGKWVQFSDN